MVRSVFLAVSGVVLITLASTNVVAETRLDAGYFRSVSQVDSVPMDSATAELDWLDNVDSSQTYAGGYQTHHSCCEGVYAGVELVIVKPYWEDEVDTLRSLVGDPQETVQGLDPGYSCSLSPRIYVGYRDCNGFGARVRYWLYDESANPVNNETVLEDFGQTITTRTRLTAALNVQALDFEATKLLDDGLFALEFSGGARYGRTEVEAALDQEIEFEVQGGEPSLETSAFRGRTRFEGVGPTVSAEARHLLRGTHLSFVGNIRGSLLFGKSSTTASQIVEESDDTFINDGNDDIVPVIEAQIGAEYARQVGHGRLAVRALMEGQWWGVSTPGASFARDAQGIITEGSDLYTTGRDLGFFGVTAAVIYQH